MGKLGGSGSEFTCLENLWGKESGWNPNAQNPSSTAYGIAQFLDSTWAGTGHRQDLGRLPADRRRAHLHREALRLALRRVVPLAGQRLVLSPR